MATIDRGSSGVLSKPALRARVQEAFQEVMSVPPEAVAEKRPMAEKVVQTVEEQVRLRELEHLAVVQKEQTRIAAEKDEFKAKVADLEAAHGRRKQGLERLLERAETAHAEKRFSKLRKNPAAKEIAVELQAAESSFESEMQSLHNRTPSSISVVIGGPMEDLRFAEEMLGAARKVQQMIEHRSADRGEGSVTWNRLRTAKAYFKQANPRDSDAKALLLVGCAATGKSMAEMNALFKEASNLRADNGNPLTRDGEALAVLALGAALSGKSILEMGQLFSRARSYDGRNGHSHDGKAYLALGAAMSKTSIEDLNALAADIQKRPYRNEGAVQNERAALLACVVAVTGRPREDVCHDYTKIRAKRLPELNAAAYMTLAASVFGVDDQEILKGYFASNLRDREAKAVIAATEQITGRDDVPELYRLAPSNRERDGEAKALSMFAAVMPGSKLPETPPQLAGSGDSAARGSPGLRPGEDGFTPPPTCLPRTGRVWRPEPLA